MPRDGSPVLSDIRSPTLAMVCEPCGRRGSYSVAQLIAEHGGDVKLTDVLTAIVGCPKARSASSHDHRKAVFQGLAVRR